MKTIVVYGCYPYLEGLYEQLLKVCSIDYFCANKEHVKESFKKQYPFIRAEEIRDLNDPFVIIAQSKEEDVLRAVKILNSIDVPYTHLDFLVHAKKNIVYLNALRRFTDLNGNSVEIAAALPDTVTIEFSGLKNSRLKIGRIKVTQRLYIKMCGENAEVSIGDLCTFVSSDMLVSSHGKICIGEDCMMASEADFRQSDAHLIFDKDTLQRINYSKDIIIGNHVWIGRESSILGGAHIGNNSICGARTVTSGTFGENVIIAGCPGKVIRENVLWSRDLAEQCNFDRFDECKDQRALLYL